MSGCSIYYIHLKSFLVCVILLKTVRARVNYQWLCWHSVIWEHKIAKILELNCKRQTTVCLTVSEIGGGKWRPGENKDTA